MKYIRTKDGIYDLDKIELCAEYYCIDNENQLYVEWYAVKETFEIIKQADTIEELCDYEMHYDNNGEFVIRPIKHVDWASLKRVIMNKWFKDCKLAIKTDKGLIFVAQMNETTGDIELL